MRHVIFPKANERDYAELPEILTEDLTAHFAQTYDDVYRVAFGSDEELERISKEMAALRAEKEAGKEATA